MARAPAGAYLGEGGKQAAFPSSVWLSNLEQAEEMRPPAGPVTQHPPGLLQAPSTDGVCTAVCDAPLRAEQEQDSRVHMTQPTSQLCHCLAGCVP